MNRAVFFDRDGTLIEEKEYLHQADQVRLYPETGPALRRLQEAGFLLFLVTNQSGVGRGYFTLEDVTQVHQYLLRLLAGFGVRIARIYVAHEAPDQPSRGRKPSPQFLFDARDEFGLDLSQSYLIGDKRTDLESGWNAGVRQSILVRTGYGNEIEAQVRAEAPSTVMVENVGAAADWILRQLQLGVSRTNNAPASGASVGSSKQVRTSSSKAKREV